MSVFCARPASTRMFARSALCCGGIILFSGFLAAPANAEIFTYRDNNGVMVYTNIPTNNPRSRPLRRDDFTRSYRSTAQYFVDAAKRQEFAALIETAASVCEIKPELVHAVVTVESGYRATAVSPKGAVGLMQLMPETARQYGVANRRDPQQNLRGGTRYLCDLLAQFNNDLSMALAAYNAGPNAVNRYRGIPPYEETRNYVDLVLDYYRHYRSSL